MRLMTSESNAFVCVIFARFIEIAQQKDKCYNVTLGCLSVRPRVRPSVHRIVTFWNPKDELFRIIYFWFISPKRPICHLCSPTFLWSGIFVPITRPCFCSWYHLHWTSQFQLYYYIAIRKYLHYMNTYKLSIYLEL